MLGTFASASSNIVQLVVVGVTSLSDINEFSSVISDITPTSNFDKLDTFVNRSQNETTILLSVSASKNLGEATRFVAP